MMTHTLRMLARSIFALTAIALALIWPLISPLAGQSTQEDSARAARRDSAARPLPATVITGTREPRRPQDLSFAVSTLSAEQLRREPSLSAATALSRLPSVAIEEAAGVGGPTSLRLRGGEESFSQVMFDGIPLNLTGGFMDLQGLTMTNVERVELARGPLSVMYGSSAISGAVQFITRAGRPGPAQVSLRAEGGRAGDRGGQSQGELLVSGGSERVQYSLGAGGTSVRGIYALPHDLRTYDASARVDAELNSAWRFTGTLRFMDISSKLPVRDPGATVVPLDPNQRDARTRLLTGVTAAFEPTASWKHEVTLSAGRDDFEYIDESDGLNPADYTYFLFDADFGLTSLQWRKTVQYAGTWRPAGDARSTLLAFGFNAEREDVAVVQTGDFGDANSYHVRDHGGAFAEFQGRIGSRLDVLGGARVERVEGLGTAFLPRLGVVLVLAPEVTRLRASVGRAFKAPNLEQQYLVNPFTLSNPGLRPETSVSAEIGFEHEWRASGLTMNLTAFRQSYEDLIRLVPIDTAGRSQNRNLGESRASGVELQLGKALSTSWSVSTGASWIKTEMIDNVGLGDALYPVGSQLLGVPRWSANVVLDGDLTPRVSLVARARLVGGQEVFTRRFSGARVALDPYSVFGLTLKATLRDNLETYVRAENLFAQRFDTAFDRPGIPLTLVAGVRVANR